MRPTIAREAMPTPIPRGRLADRLAAIERIGWQIGVDAFATAEQLRLDGWSSEELAGAMHGYREWWVGQVDAAVDAALTFWAVAS